TRTRIFDRQMRDAWEQQGAKTLEQTARERAGEILKNHAVPPLPEDISRELRKIVKKCDADI
ncbi:MAG: Trimethylamine methyltransferase MttB, partial [Planctomycetes bacterium]|nr:Trimethylamine methyltransferase MttB [Planctomycetota bacterium]